ncbi:MAG TPA: chromosomal replication initiator protein DnaA, partial [Gemmatimonadales bacterium]
MQANQVWQVVLSELRGSMAHHEFDTMLKTSTIAAFDDGKAVVAMPNAYAAEWSETRLTAAVERIMGQIVGYPVTVRFGVRDGEGYYMPANDGRGNTLIRESGKEQTPYTALPGSPHGGSGESEGRGNGAARKTPTPRFGAIQAELGVDDSTPLNPRYMFEYFIVGSGNRLAHAASLAVADSPGHAYNPLFLYGGVGLGKTHLLHAIGHQAMQRFGNVRVLYVSSEKFTNDMINAIRRQQTEEFRIRYRNIDILLIDDIQFIAGKESTQEEFFHTFNTLHSAGKQIVISSDRPPKAILTLEERLRSRFEWGLIVDVQTPDLETRTAILRAKAEQMVMHIPPEVIDFLAHRIQSNIRELEGCLNRVAAYAQLTHSAVSVEVASAALTELLD